MRDWDLLVVAGPSGVGKSHLSYPLAQHFGVAITEVDDLLHSVEALTTEAQQPMIHYWRTHPEAQDFPPEQILPIHLDVCAHCSPRLLP